MTTTTRSRLARALELLGRAPARRPLPPAMPGIPTTYDAIEDVPEEVHDRLVAIGERARPVTAKAFHRIDAIEAARELLEASKLTSGDDNVRRWIAAKARFLEVVGFRPDDRAAIDELGVTRVFTVKAIEGDEAVFDLDPFHRNVRRPVARLVPITAELLVAAGEVLDELEEVGS